jgi:exoribonuclease-2
MILANHLAARALREKELPCPYRTQEKMRDGQEWPKGLPESPKERLAYALSLRRRGGRTGLSLCPSPHWGLGLSSYTTFTSPMRRYLDLLVARQLRSLGPGYAPAYDREKFMALAMPADEMSRSIKRMQISRTRYWLAVYLQNRIGEEFSGLVFEIQGNRYRVCLTDFMLETDLFKPPRGLELGLEITLRLAKADPREAVLRFEPSR